MYLTIDNNNNESFNLTESSCNTDIVYTCTVTFLGSLLYYLLYPCDPIKQHYNHTFNHSNNPYPSNLITFANMQARMYTIAMQEICMTCDPPWNFPVIKLFMVNFL